MTVPVGRDTVPVVGNGAKRSSRKLSPAFSVTWVAVWGRVIMAYADGIAKYAVLVKIEGDNGIILRCLNQGENPAERMIIAGRSMKVVAEGHDTPDHRGLTG